MFSKLNSTRHGITDGSAYTDHFTHVTIIRLSNETNETTLLGWNVRGGTQSFHFRRLSMFDGM